MLNWLKKKITRPQQNWLRAHQTPGIAFPFPKGAKLRPEEEMMLALPAALIADHEKIGSVLLCDDDAELTLNEKAGAWCVKLKPGMTFSLAKSCDIMVIAEDTRPRFFQYMAPEKRVPEPDAPPNAGSAGAPPVSVG